MIIEKRNLGKIKFNHIHTTKFTTNSFLFIFNTNLDRLNVTSRTLLSNMMTVGTKKFPTKRLLASELENLYGASFSTRVSKKGNTHSIIVQFSFLSELFTSDENYFDKCLNFIYEILFNSNISDERKLKLEKKTLKNEILSIKDDKVAYGFMRLISIAFSKENYAIPAYGYVSDLKFINTDIIKYEYQNMISENNIDIYYVGDKDFDIVNQKMDKIFEKLLCEKQTEKRVDDYFFKKTLTIPEEVATIFEITNTMQSALYYGFTLPIFFTDDKYIAAILFNIIFGSGANSRLFKTLREKHSLCYSVYSSINLNVGFLSVYIGLSKVDDQKLTNLIKNEINDLASGNITDDELQNVKQILLDEANGVIDSISGIMNFHIRNNVINRERKVEDLIAEINNIREVDIINVAKQLKHITTYLLTDKTWRKNNEHN